MANVFCSLLLRSRFVVGLPSRILQAVDQDTRSSGNGPAHPHGAHMGGSLVNRLEEVRLYCLSPFHLLDEVFPDPRAES